MSINSPSILTPRDKQLKLNQTLCTPKIHKLTDASTQGQIQQWVDIDVHQMGAGTYQGTCTTLSSEHFHVVHEQQNRLIHKVGIMPKNYCTVSFALGQDPIKRFSHFKNPDPLTFLLPENTEFDILVPDEVDTLYLCLEQDRLLTGGRILNPRFWEGAPRGLNAYNTPDTGKLALGLLSLLTPSNHDANRSSAVLSVQTETLLLDSILLAINKSTEVLGCDSPEYQARQRARQRVNHARDYIDASLQTGLLPSIVDICAQTGTSARTLQYAFREVMQMTPVAYLRILRLNKVRSTLQTSITADTTVTQVGTHWGFLHLGEFARDYQRLFGERPSETLALAHTRNLVS